MASRLCLSTASPSRGKDSHPSWLSSILSSNVPPPKLYAWTPSNLPGIKTTSRRRDEAQEQRRIYILGVGNLGRLFACTFSRLPSPPPITLVVHRPELLEQWSKDSAIELESRGKVERFENFDIELWTEGEPEHGDVREVASGGTVRNLVIATKASGAVQQADRVRRYLSRDSTVVFAQNGVCKLWPPHGQTYLAERYPTGTGHPSYLAAITMHGVFSRGPFKSVFAAEADLKIGPVCLGDSSAGTADYLTDCFAASADLNASRLSKEKLWVSQLEKLVVNVIINPLTAILREKNGSLFDGSDGNVEVVMDHLLRETSAVLQALVRHPSTRSTFGILDSHEVNPGQEALVQRFSFEKLKGLVWNAGARVAQNRSSMFQDAEAGRPTEIRDLNGYIVEMAAWLPDELDVTFHQLVIGMVERREVLKKTDFPARFPIKDA